MKGIKKLIPTKNIKVWYQKKDFGVAWAITDGENITITFGDIDTNTKCYHTSKVLSGSQLKKLQLDNLSIKGTNLISGRIKLQLVAATDRPSLPSIENCEKISSEQLPPSILDFKEFVSKDNRHPNFNGVCFTKEGLTVATDRIKMLFRKHSAHLEKDYMITTAALEALSHLPKPTLHLVDSCSKVTSGSITVYSNNVNYSYTNYNLMIPSNPPHIFSGKINLKDVDLIVDSIAGAIVFHGVSAYTRNGSVEVLEKNTWLADYPVGLNLGHLKKCIKVSGNNINVSCLGEGRPVVINNEILLMPVNQKFTEPIWEMLKKKYLEM